ncbi:MAG: plasmid pRiA4b ORF-3 family protein [Acidothermaceae bacterium]
MNQPRDAEAIVKQLLAAATPEQSRALLDGLLNGRVSSIFEKLDAEPTPTLRPAPASADVRGFRVRLDLHGAKPPVWRRLELAGNLTLPRVHDVIQAAMGWTDSHLHRFRTGADHRSPYFVTAFDLDEGDEGVLEDDVRLDQVVGAAGDAIWYEYDFGDGWDHVLKVEEVLNEPPTTASCLGGRMACPPEDCGGIGGYEELAEWVRSGYAETLLPEAFDDAAHGRDWLPLDWHPDQFDIDEANDALAVASAEPVVVTNELADLLEQLERRGLGRLREVLGRPVSHGPTDVSDDDAAHLVEPYRILLDVVGDGVALTSAGYLPPKVVEQFAEAAGITRWWIGKANREDLTPPVAAARETARAIGLVTVRKGRLKPTAAGIRVRHDSRALLQHIVGRLPLGTKDFDRQAGWMALAAVGSGTPAEEWHETISDLLADLGWRTDRDPYSRPSAHSTTLVVLENLAGAARIGWRVTGTHLALAATARRVIRPR